jgi:hypothetical protein
LTRYKTYLVINYFLGRFSSFVYPLTYKLVLSIHPLRLRFKLHNIRYQEVFRDFISFRIFRELGFNGNHVTIAGERGGYGTVVTEKVGARKPITETYWISFDKNKSKKRDGPGAWCRRLKFHTHPGPIALMAQFCVLKLGQKSTQ